MERGHECYHCKQWIAAGEAHDCWSTTEAALTADLHEDLREAYDRLRATAAAIGDQRIYASHNSIMFARRTCYCFVRPKRAWLEVCVFLGRELRAPLVKRVDRVSRTKVAHMLRVTHRDEIEPPMSDWLREAYDFAGEPATTKAATVAIRDTPPRKRAAKKR
jgi:hypothetical protein